ncbi:MAG: hypothetical protein R2911_06145 [Caldilineaceae bacterium]
MKLSTDQIDVLAALAVGAVLKSHRDLDGHKVYRLHPLQGSSLALSPHMVDPLKRHKLIESNMKFPAATYILTDKGRQFVEQQVQVPVNSLTARKFAP